MDVEFISRDTVSKAEPEFPLIIKLANSYPSRLKQLYSDIDKKRNNLAHANSNGKFEDIKKSINDLLINYENLAIKRAL